jgi:hypothetical protein
VKAIRWSYLRSPSYVHFVLLPRALNWQMWIPCDVEYLKTTKVVLPQISHSSQPVDTAEMNS